MKIMKGHKMMENGKKKFLSSFVLYISNVIRLSGKFSRFYECTIHYSLALHAAFYLIYEQIPLFRVG